MKILTYKDFLLEASINPLYKEFRIRDKENDQITKELDKGYSNPNTQMELF